MSFFKNIFKDKTRIWICLIVVLAGILRFYNYQNRWALAYDQAWFAIIGRYAVDTFQLPLLGPFASGGPFQTGGEWFWIVMVGTLMYPPAVIAPWVFITLLSVVQVYFMYVIGRELINKNFGILVSLLCAVSTSQTLQATNLTSQMTTSLCASLLIFFIIKYLKRERSLYLFLSGISVGLASAIHLQGVLLIVPLFVFIIFSRSFRVRKLFIIFLGLLIPWLPVLIVDITNNFYNTKNMFLYFVHPQGQATYEVLGRRWLTFVLSYIPNSWGRIIGGDIILGYLELALVGFTIAIHLIKRRLSLMWSVIVVSVGVTTIILRYIKAPLFENYITFLHPFIFLLVGYALWNIILKTKFFGYVLILTIISGSIFSTVQEVRGSTNLATIQSQKYMNFLKEKYPNEKFALYDYKYLNTGTTLPLVLYLQTNGLVSDSGRRLGLAFATSGAQMNFLPHKAIYGEPGEYQIFELSASSSSSLGKAKWAAVNPSYIYNSVENWYKK